MPHHRRADACCCVCACCAEVALVLNGHGPVCVTGGEEELSEEERARRQVRVCVCGGGRGWRLVVVGHASSLPGSQAAVPRLCPLSPLPPAGAQPDAACGGAEGRCC